MRELWLSRTTLIWGLLVVATLLSWQIGHGVGFDSAKAAGVAILFVTFVKVRFVMLEFIEFATRRAGCASSARPGWSSSR